MSDKELFPGSIEEAERRLANRRYPDYPKDIPRDVCIAFEAYAFILWRRGCRRNSSDFVLHCVRWFTSAGNKAALDGHFKCSNNWTPTLARWLMDKYPMFKGFFRTRPTKRERLAMMGLLNDPDSNGWDFDE